MTPAEARRRFASAPVGHLATADADARPHLVPFVFAVDLAELVEPRTPGAKAGVADRIYTAVDHKPKRTTALKRLANVAENPAVAALVDYYDDDWERLWWVRADGSARLLEKDSAEERRAVELLLARHRQYRDRPPLGPVLAIDVARWSAWDAGERAGTFSVGK